MNYLTKLYVRVTERKGQTMAEYALIMGAIAVVCIAAYQTLGTTINTVIGNVTSNL